MGLFLAGALQAQEAPLAFPAQAEVVTVDVVVLGKDGTPVRGLTKNDFIVEDDGEPHEIVAFEVRDLETPARAAAAAGQSATVADQPAEGDGTPGRTLALIVDDLGLDERGPAALESIKNWIADEADSRDSVTLLTSSGEVEWAGRVRTGRAELAHALSRIRLRREPRLTMVNPKTGKIVQMSEWEAYQTVSGRGGSGGQGAMLAQEVLRRWRDRAPALVSAIERFASEHAEERGRKTAIVFTQGFIRDDELKFAEQAADSAQRANVALYFIDPRGLIAGQDVFPADRVFEATHNLDLAGAQQMADQTGGTLARSNDLAGQLTEMVNESSAYYLLGYASTRQPDGRWHELDVKVARRSATVRARRGYYASARPLSAELAEEAREEEPAAAAKTPEAPSDSRGAGERLQAEAPPGAPPAAQSQSSAQVPTFPARAEGVTVDVVVLDKAGRPVRGLRRADFAILEDGRAQEIVSFARLGLPPERAGESRESPDESVEPAERTLTFLVDDLGITQVDMAPTIEALSRWLSERADPRDEVTLVTSSGSAWWSATLREGREDLEAVLRRLRGRKGLGRGRDELSDWEASYIDTLDNPFILNRVVKRWFNSGACLKDPLNPESSVHLCRAQVKARAREVYSDATRRATGLLGAVEWVSRGLADCRGRKSIVILSEGFLRDTDHRAFRRAVDASRHGNTSVSFVDVRGLIALPLYGADQVELPVPGDLGAAAAESRVGDTAGGEHLAETTGGSMVRDTNDIEGAVARLADESSFYYLLGYQPDRPADGRWRGLKVKVARRGVTVRARRGYYATAAPRVAERPVVKPGEKRKEKGPESLPVRPVDPALSAGGTRDGIPVRIAPHVLEMSDKEEVRVMVAIEVGTSAVTFSGTGDDRTTSLDVELLAVSRDQPTVVPLDSRVELGLDSQSVGGRFILAREVRLPAGVAQVRVLVRDAASGRSGLAVRRVEIPAAGTPYMSTPVFALLDETGKGRPRLVPMARRSFAAEGVLFCSYEVYPAPARAMRVMPRVMGSFRIIDEVGKVVAHEEPKLIGIGLGGLIQRSLAIPIAALSPGHYGLTIEADDRGTGFRLDTTQSFDIVAPAAASAIAH